MRRLLSLTLAVTLSTMTLPISAADAAQAGGTITGTAQNQSGQALGNYTVRVRNLDTGNLAGSTTSSVAGNFSFAGLAPGNYAIEIVNAAGNIVGTSPAITLAAGATVSISVTAAAAVAAASAAGISTALLVTTLAAAGGVTGIVVAAKKGDASPSK
jgi:hypothetical protein